MIAALEIVIPALYAISIAVLLAYGGNLLWLAVYHAVDETEREGPVPDPEDIPEPDASWPTVTVQLPLYNEADVVDRLIDACAALDYPRRKLEIQVLDDSTDETVDKVLPSSTRTSSRRPTSSGASCLTSRRRTMGRTSAWCRRGGGI